MGYIRKVPKHLNEILALLLELDVMEDMIEKLKRIIDPDAVLLAKYRGTIIGYCLGFPDLYGIIKKDKRQHKRIDSMLYIQLYKRLLKKKICMEANYILEDNVDIKNALVKLGMVHNKTYRIYKKQL